MIEKRTRLRKIYVELQEDLCAIGLVSDPRVPAKQNSIQRMHNYRHGLGRVKTNLLCQFNKFSGSGDFSLETFFAWLAKKV